jgi:hypothetical protein
MDLACSGSYMISYIVFMVEAMWSICVHNVLCISSASIIALKSMCFQCCLYMPLRESSSNIINLRFFNGI